MCNGKNQEFQLRGEGGESKGGGIYLRGWPASTSTKPKSTVEGGGGRTKIGREMFCPVEAQEGKRTLSEGAKNPINESARAPP